MQRICSEKILLCFFIVFFITTHARAQSTLPDEIFHADTIKRIVSFLAADSLKGRLTGSGEISKATNFIAKEFQQSGLLPVAGMEGYFSEFLFWDNRSEQRRGMNVIGAIPGKSKKEELILFCAHYDHVGTKSTNPNEIYSNKVTQDLSDTIYNGANDNASGTAAILLLGRYFVKLANNERTILFITFSGEEFGLKGSYAFSSLIDPNSVKAVINIEMIGRGLTSNKQNPYITGEQFSDLDEILNNRLRKQKMDSSGRKIYFKKDPYIQENLFSRSDNYPFAVKGIPAHTLMATSPADDYYHSVNDEIELLDFRNMSHIIKAIALSCTGLVTGKDTPSRIDTKKL